MDKYIQQLYRERYKSTIYGVFYMGRNLPLLAPIYTCSYAMCCLDHAYSNSAQVWVCQIHKLMSACRSWMLLLQLQHQCMHAGYMLQRALVSLVSIKKWVVLMNSAINHSLISTHFSICAYFLTVHALNNPSLQYAPNKGVRSPSSTATNQVWPSIICITVS